MTSDDLKNEIVKWEDKVIMIQDLMGAGPEFTSETLAYAENKVKEAVKAFEKQELYYEKI